MWKKRAAACSVIIVYVGIYKYFWLSWKGSPPKNDSDSPSKKCYESCFVRPEFELIRKHKSIRWILLDKNKSLALSTCREKCAKLSDDSGFVLIPNNTNSIWVGLIETDWRNHYSKGRPNTRNDTLFASSEKTNFTISKLTTNGAFGDEYYRFMKPAPNVNDEYEIAVLKAEFKVCEFLPNLWIPKNTVAFAWKIEHARFISCNHTVASEFRKNNADSYKTRVISHKDGLEALKMVRDISYNAHVISMLWDGTLLGWYRECDLIPHTHDLDTVFHYDDFRPGLIEELKQKCLLAWRSGYPEDSLQLRLDINNVPADIFGLYPHESGYRIFGVDSSSRERVVWSYPNVAKTKCSTDLLGRLFHVPCNPREILDFTYGPNFTVASVKSRDFYWKNGSLSSGVDKQYSLEEWPNAFDLGTNYYLCKLSVATGTFYAMIIVSAFCLLLCTVVLLAFWLLIRNKKIKFII